jgi:succinoglycan biosynthesis transport protein ExoP
LSERDNPIAHAVKAQDRYRPNSSSDQWHSNNWGKRLTKERQAIFGKVWFWIAGLLVAALLAPFIQKIAEDRGFFLTSEGRADFVASLSAYVQNPLYILIVGCLLGYFIAQTVVLKFVKRDLEQQDLLSMPAQDADDLSEKIHVRESMIVPLFYNFNWIDVLQGIPGKFFDAYFSVVEPILTDSYGVGRSIFVTSYAASEGKTTSSIGIAHCLAKSGHKTLLLDCDFRRRGLTKAIEPFFELGPSKKGSHVLSNFKSTQKTIKSRTRKIEDNLECLHLRDESEHRPVDFVRLRDSKLIENLEKMYDFVVVDGPPILGLADAPLLSSQCSDLLFVFRAHHQKIKTAKKALDRLRCPADRSLCVVTHVGPEMAASWGYGAEYGYGYNFAYNSIDDEQRSPESDIIGLR